MIITVPKIDPMYHCPFSGSRNTCGAMPTGQHRTNACPGWDDDADKIIPPKDCPLMDGPITVKMET